MVRFTSLAAAVTVLASATTSAGGTSIEECENADWPPHAVKECSAQLGAASTDPLARGRLYTLRGVAWLKDEEPTAAVSEFSRALSIDATNISALRGRAQAYAALAKHDLALLDWNRIVELRPDDAEHLRDRGAANLAVGNKSDALEDYSKALSIDPRNVAAYVGRATVHDALNDRTKALDDFAQALRIDPTYIPAYWERALMAERWGDRTLAIESYQTLLKHDDGYWEAYKALQQHGINGWNID